MIDCNDNGNIFDVLYGFFLFLFHSPNALNKIAKN